MKLRLVAALTLIAATLTATPSHAAEARVVTGVSAYYRVDLGYMVTWQNPADTSRIASYTVTANPGGKTCVARGSNSNACTFTNQTLGFKDTYTFTVTVNAAETGPASVASNPIRHYSIPGAPTSGASKRISDTQIDITWIPSTETGNLPLYGYTVTYWPSTPYGDPIGTEGKSFVATSTNASITGLKPSTWYVINVAACNAAGCNSMDSWLYQYTTPVTTSITNFRMPRIINGGTAETTCFTAIWDGGTSASTGSTYTKSSSSCPIKTIDPSKYPVIDPTATKLPTFNIATKFKQSASLMGFSKQYSMKEWSKTNGFVWFAYFYATSKSVTLGFTTPVTITSLTPTVCTADERWIRFVSTGTCKLTGSAAGNEIFMPSNVATGSFLIVP